MVQFDVGPLSLAAARLLAGGTAVYAVLTAIYAWNGHRVRLQDRWSATAGGVVMALLAATLWIDGARLLPAPFSLVLVGVFALALVFTLTWTLGRYKQRIERFKEEAGARLQALLRQALPEDRYDEWIGLRDRFRLGHEERRKAPHLMMGLVIAGYLVLGHWVLQGIWRATGMRGPATELSTNLHAATTSGWLVAGHVASLTVLLTILFVITPTELLRLRFPELSYPFKDIILTRLRERERGLFGAHYYIAAAVPLAALWLGTPATWEKGIPAIMALVAITVFADAASALVGVRLGKRKWFHHPGKSYMGTIGGTLVAVAVAVPFVGLPMALASGLVFAVLDAVAPVPIPVSDNILNPVGLALCYIVGWAWLDPMLPFY